MTRVRLELWLGTTSINLLNPAPGIALNEWIPQVAQYKDGGLFQDSPL